MGAPSGTPRINPFSWVLLATLLAWNIWSLLPRPHPEAMLPYSEFLTQVAKGNAGTGSAADTKAAASAASSDGKKAQANTKPRATASAKASPPPTYTRFRTTFPGVVGDSSLMPLLQSRHVVIDVAAPSTPWFAAQIDAEVARLLAERTVREGCDHPVMHASEREQPRRPGRRRAHDALFSDLMLLGAGGAIAH